MPCYLSLMSLTLATWLFILLAMADTLEATNACTIETPQGRFIGHRSSIHPEVCEFLGVPYAAPPIGDLRFAPPELSTLKGDFHAETYGPDCPQNPSKPYQFPDATQQYDQVFDAFASTLDTKHAQSEDCLTLNLWMKANATSADRHPVLVWIHGGRHSTGTSNTPFYNGANYVASQNAVFVTFNFRMNIFGFPGAPEATQNIGLLDHYAAVQWVHNNVQNFGGNSGQITLFGQSSGAVAASNWAYAFRDKPLVAKTGAHSGNQFSFPTNTMEMAARNWFNVTDALGCGADGETLACMRKPEITVEAILQAVKRVPAVPQKSVARSQPQFQVTQDGKTFFSTKEYLSRAKSGKLAKLPFLQINGDHESGFYRISAQAAGHTLTEKEWLAFERESFTCPLAAEAFYRSQQGIPTYRFRNMPDWLNTRLYSANSTQPDSGAYHGTELHSILGNSELVSGIAPEQAQQSLSTIMGAWWYCFAAEDNATDTKAVPKGCRSYEPGRECLGLFGKDNSDRIEFVDPAKYDSQCHEGGYDFWDVDIDAAPRNQHAGVSKKHPGRRAPIV